MKQYRSLFLALALASTGIGLAATPMPAMAQGTPAPSSADDARQREFESLRWLDGKQPVTERATITLPKGIRYLDAANTDKLLKLTGNLPEKDSITIAPDDLRWFAILDFEDIGYVKDDEKIDAAALLKTMQDNQVAANEQRKEQGMNPLFLTGWSVPPHYDGASHNLEYGMRLSSADGANINYTARLLGRRGVMTATLITSEQGLKTDLPAFRTALAGFAYTPDERYAAYQDGDKVSEYGLAALVTGGAAAAALKGGLLKGLIAGLAAFWKVILAGIIAAGAAIGRLLGRKKDSEEG